MDCYDIVGSNLGLVDLLMVPAEDSWQLSQCQYLQALSGNISATWGLEWEALAEAAAAFSYIQRYSDPLLDL
jgi:hypothetical protein